MGCHTWAAYKCNRSIEEVRQIWIEKRIKWIEDYQKYIDNPDLSPFERDSMESKIWNMSIYKRQLQIVKKGLCNVAVMNDQPEHSYYISDKGFYIVCNDFHDMFRVSGYPKDILFSYQESLDFISKYENQYNTKIKIDYYNENDKNLLREFWEKYPEGIIFFG